MRKRTQRHRRRMLAALAVLGGLSWTCTAGAAAGATMGDSVMTLADADNGKSVALRVGESVTLRLYENPTT